MRKSWDETWLDCAQVIAVNRSLCIRAQVGAVIVSPHNEVVSTGYNGPPAGLEYTEMCDTWCSRARRDGPSNGTDYGLSCPTIHAEENALMRANWREMQGGAIYTTRTPCNDCAKKIGGSGVAKAVFPILEIDQAYGVDNIIAFLHECGIKVVPVESRA